MKKIVSSLLLILILGLEYSFSQPGLIPNGFGNNGVGANGGTYWARGGNNNFVNTNNIFGTMFPSPIYIYTGSAPRAMWTTGSALSGIGSFGSGDGLRILNSASISAATGHLDLWTAGASSTHIKWDGSGHMDGQNLFLEIHGVAKGIYYNAANNQGTALGFNPNPRHLFNINAIEVGRIGKTDADGFYRIGVNPFTNDAFRRLEVVDQVNNPQFRISFSQAGGVNFTDFQTTSLGDLAILPTGGSSTPRRVGINTTTPGNTLEINSILASAATSNGNPAAPPFVGNATGTSGLRFSDLNSTSIPQVNPGPGILTLNSLGDLIYSPERGLGNICSAAPTNPLMGDWEIPMANFNYHFTDGGSTATKNNVGIGTNCNALNARLKVVNPVMLFGIDASTTTIAGTNVGIHGIAANATLRSYGVAGEALSASPSFNTAVAGHAANAVQTNTAGFFQADGNGGTNIGTNGIAIGLAVPTSINYGVLGHAQDGLEAYGVRGEATGATNNYGIYGEALPALGIAGPNYAGYFNGDVLLTGADNFSSDSILKQNVDSISNVWNIIKELKPKTYEFRVADYPQMGLSNRRQYGFIAQEVETILPELVGSAVQPAVRDTLGAIVTPALTYKTLNYQAFTAILMKGIQEQAKSIDSLKEENNNQDSINTSLQNQINALADIINACCSSHSMQQNGNQSQSTSQISVDLKDGQTIVLEQNVPNPFAEQTTINYFLPDNTVKAQMLFYNAQGRLIQSVDLNQKGNGSLNVFASDLTNGIYTYSLVADGKIFATKKMVKQ